MPPRATYRILSLDGGGIRGLIAAIWLNRLEQKLEPPLWKHFDLVAGTSTGAILACAVAAEIETERIVRLYRDEGRSVFPSPRLGLARRAVRFWPRWVWGPRYGAGGLEGALDAVFDATRFEDLKPRVLVTAYDTFTGKPVILKSDRARHRRILVRDVCRASAAAPTYFPPHVLRIGGARVPLIDGGVVANNPTACAIAEAVRRNRAGPAEDRPACGLSDLLAASFGTGDVVRRIPGDEARRWSTVRWAEPVIDVLFGGSSDAVDYIAGQLLPRENYFRFQFPLDRQYEAMDNAQPENLDVLTHLATAYIDSGEGRRKLESLVARLIATG
jgi:hypothetical protein